MSELKTALDMGDDARVIALTNNVKEITKTARGSKARIRCATRVLALNQSVEGDSRIAKWTEQKVATSVMQGLFDVVGEHEEVDRFCDLLGQRLMDGSLNRVQGNMIGIDWHWCVKTLLLMRDSRALAFVLDYAEQSPHGSPGTLNLLARGGDLKHEAERVKRYVHRWEGTDKLGHATRDWILAKLGDADAYESLIKLCLYGSMDADNAMRAAQAIAHINQWDVPWGMEGTEIVRSKL